MLKFLMAAGVVGAGVFVSELAFWKSQPYMPKSLQVDAANPGNPSNRNALIARYASIGAGLLIVVPIAWKIARMKGKAPVGTGSGS